MSAKAFNAVTEARGLTMSERCVLWRMADQADDSGYSWLGHETIAGDLETTKRTIQRLINGYERKIPGTGSSEWVEGLIDRGYVEGVYAGGGRNRPALYRIMPDVLDDDPDRRRGRLAYERRFGKGVKLSPFQRRQTVTPMSRNDDTDDAKGRHRRHPTLKETQRNGAGAGSDEPPADRRPDETATEYLERKYRERTQEMEPSTT